MKTLKTKLSQIAMIAVLGITFFACGGKAKDAAKDTTETVASAGFEWVDVDLSTTKAKFPIVVKSRKDSKITENMSDEIELENEDMIMNYRVSAYTAGIDASTMESVKKAAKENESYKFEKFIIDQPDSFIIKTSMGYMVGRFVKAGEITYECAMIPLHALEKEQDAQELYKMMGMLKLKS